ncbi:MAG TPA: sigma 54-interacting transcriptional regulator [Steroidobacteraceae bacterium]|nr:sigma 54-interacting transcriptional regulator [Steroidobacteraceae bacterium]
MNTDAPPVTSSLGFDAKDKASKLRRRAEEKPVDARHGARILLVDNDAALCRLLSDRLGAANYEVESVSCARAALDACARSRPNLVITELRLEPMDGLGLLKELKSRWPELSVIILTAHGTIPEAVKATQCGAFGFLVKPVDRPELLGQVQRAIASTRQVQSEGAWRADIVSRSELMEDRLRQANRAASTDSPIILTGESGTGKELFARAIHAASARREKPFIAVTCRAATEEVLDAELFGRQKSGAGGAESGAFQLAQGGTLLLHEIGDLPMGLQLKLIDALRDDHESTGRNRARTDVRLICTASDDLAELIKSGKFREDLYYRINVLPIEVPPLGRRREDIPLLISHFLEQTTVESGLAKKYSPKAVELLVAADWPGNVRQLFELVRENVVHSEGEVMTEEIVQQSLGTDSTRIPSYEDARDEFSRGYLIRNLRSTKGNVTRAARLAKRNRSDFYKLLARYRILADDFKNPPHR